MNFLYILSEDDNDDIFYKGCIENLTGKSFNLIPRRIRKGGGISQVRRHIPYLLSDIKYTGKVENTFFVIALDNDRSPAHPDHKRLTEIDKLPKREQRKDCRFCEIQKITYKYLGSKDKWPLKGAIAVPVQMIESWLLLISKSEEYENESELPIFARKDSSLAKDYFAPKKPPSQLKDLCETEKKRLNITSSRNFFIHCAKRIASSDIHKSSNSFSLFKEQVKVWFNK